MKTYNILLTFLFFIVLHPARAESELGRGFYYYQDNTEALNKPENKLARKTSPPVTVFRRADWLEKNHKKILHQALDNPTKHNVLKALFINKLMQDKTTRFADTAKSLIQTNPFLDEASRRPLSSFGARFADNKAAKAKEILLRDISSKSGIYFFFISTCQACHQEAPLLQSFANHYDFTIKAVSIDGLPLKLNLFKDYVPNQGQAEKLGIHRAPSLVLFSPPNNFGLIAEGSLLAEDELADRIINAAYNMKIVSKQKYDSAKPILHNGLLTDLITPLANKQPLYDLDNFIEKLQKDPGL